MQVDQATLSLLHGVGYTDDQLQSAVTRLTSIDEATQNAVLNIAANGVNVDSAAALVAAGFAATGWGVPIAAAISLGLPLVEGIAKLLSPEPQYAWRIGSHGGAPPGTKQPYSPKDPRWTRYDPWVQLAAAESDSLAYLGASPDDWIPGLKQMLSEAPSPAVVGMRGVIIYPAVTIPARPKSYDLFRQTYNAAWHANAEFVINGYQWVDPYVLLVAVVNAWNATHSAAQTVTITGAGPYYINHLINGDYDQKYKPPLTLHTGAVAAKPKPAPNTDLSGLWKLMAEAEAAPAPVEAPRPFEAPRPTVTAADVAVRAQIAAAKAKLAARSPVTPAPKTAKAVLTGLGVAAAVAAVAAKLLL